MSLLDDYVAWAPKFGLDRERFWADRMALASEDLCRSPLSGLSGAVDVLRQTTAMYRMARVETQRGVVSDEAVEAREQRADEDAEGGLTDELRVKIVDLLCSRESKSDDLRELAGRLARWTGESPESVYLALLELE